MRVLVCGGRDYNDWQRVAAELERIHDEKPVSIIIHGGATGADSLASWWAKAMDVPEITYHADWITYGKAAGPRRNQLMLDGGKPDLVVAFPGGRGTADMVRRAEEAGVKVMRVKSEAELFWDSISTTRDSIPVSWDEIL